MECIDIVVKSDKLSSIVGLPLKGLLLWASCCLFIVSSSFGGVVSDKDLDLVTPKKKTIESIGDRFPDGLQQTSDSLDRLDQWFTDAKFGAFIHFGLYSELAGKDQSGLVSKHEYSEWIQFAEKIPAPRYRQLANVFNPSEFDAEEWVQVYKNAGIRYVVITAKHHDGFALFDSKVSSFDIVEATPFKRDLIKELADACHANGLKFGVYYSQAQDWGDPNAPLFWNKQKDFHPSLPDYFEPDMDTYLEGKGYAQVEELVKNYEIDLIWFDTPLKMTYGRARKFAEIVRQHRPDCLINSRIILGGKHRLVRECLELFDYVSIGDKEVPETVLPMYYESPDSVSSSYGFKLYGEQYYHSEKEMIDRLVHTVCSNGNYLLNSGPMANGELDPRAVEIYETIGKWIQGNEESIYGTLPNPFGVRPPWGDISCSKDRKTLYLHVLDWPTDRQLTLARLEGSVSRVEVLSTGDSIEFRQHGGNLVLDQFEGAVDSFNTVFKVVLSKALPANE